MAIGAAVALIAGALTLTPGAAAAIPTTVYISEFMASNNAGIVDEDGSLSDWIELTNGSASAVDLTGFQLSDDASNPAKWLFPAVILQPGTQTIVWASSKNKYNPPNRPHTNFALGAGGEYLGLRNAVGVPLNEFSPSFPAQTANVSYGIDVNGNVRSFSSPTPGAPNGVGDPVDAAMPAASVARGFYSSPFTVQLTTTTPTAAIWFTTNGSIPSATNGTRYTTPVTISHTTPLRAVAVRSGLQNSPVLTVTYIFVADTISQANGIAGFPNGLLRSAGDIGGVDVLVPEDTAMDPAITNDPAYAPLMVQALTSIPSMNITAPVTSIFDSGDGFYDWDESGLEPTYAASVELLYPNAPALNQQIDAGLEPHSHNRVKRSLRIKSRAEWGPATWNTDAFRNGPLNGASATLEVRNVVLRGGNNRAWSRISNPDATTFTEDELYRSSQIAMTGFGSHGTFVHLYLNGIYYGLYNMVERPDEDWLASYFGGDDDGWYFRNHGDATSGDPARWNYLLNTLTTLDMSNPANYAELKRYLDVRMFADYMALSFWMGMTDWPDNNYYLGNRNEASGEAATPTAYWAWDGEWSLDRKKNSLTQGAWVHPAFSPTASASSDMSRVWHAARRSPAFLAMFANRVAMHCGPGGALSDTAAIARFDALNAFIRTAVIAESARWGDTLAPMGQPTRTRNIDWNREVDVIRNLLNGNAARLTAALTAKGYYDAAQVVLRPTISPSAGTVTGPVTITATAGDTIKYTLDGSDPETSVTALVYTGPLVLAQSAIVTAIALRGDNASPPIATTLIVPSFAVTELHYNPAPATPGEIAAGITDKEKFEFIELRNIASVPKSLAGVRFSTGITFAGADVIVPPDGYAILVVDPTAFALRHPSIPVSGTYTGNLSNGGEQLVGENPPGVPFTNFAYDDALPWPTSPDGTGPSLEVVHIDGDRNDPATWGASAIANGTPNRGPIDVIPPSVISVFPANGASGVGPGVAPVVTFNEAVTGTSGIVLTRVIGGAAVPAAVGLTGTSATITPTAALEAGVQYRITVPTTVRDIEGNPLSATFTSVFTIAGLEYLESGGQVVFEAEEYESNLDQGGKSWSIATGIAGSSGVSMVAMPNTGTKVLASIETTSPRMDYRIRFVTPGSYRMWVRGFAANDSDNSIHVGVDGTPTSTVTLKTYGSLAWTNTREGSGTTTLTIPAAGSFNVSVWMREDGWAIDRFMLTRSTTNTPSGVGPAASPRSAGGIDAVAPTVSSIVPVNGATDVAVSTSAQVTFSESVINTGGMSIAPAIGGASLPATTSTAGNVVTITPSSLLAASTRYRVTVPTSVTDTAGNPLAGVFASEFTTADPPPPALAYLESGGQIVFEAESDDGRTAPGSKRWMSVSGVAGASAQVVQALDNTGSSIESNVAATSPRIDYRVWFASAGTYRVWLRGRGDTEHDNSVHIGLDLVVGQPVALLPIGSLGWSRGLQGSSGVASITVPAPGVHTFHVWMREDGAIIDRILLTTSTSTTPTGSGPSSSARGLGGGSDTTAPTIASVSPVDGATGVPTTVTPQINFSEPVTNVAGITLIPDDARSGLGVDLADSNARASLESSVTVSGSTVTISPSPALTPDTRYRITVPTSVTDLAGNPLASPLQSHFVTATAGGGGDGDGYQESGGVLVFEAEGTDATLERAGSAWVPVPGIAGASGGMIRALPNAGKSISTSIDATSPRADYRVQISTPGVYRVWVRGEGDIENDNSVHVGVDGVVGPSITFVPVGSLVWSQTPQGGGVATVTFPSAGSHTFNLWMREDGARIDKFLLTTNVATVPAGTGPLVSPRTGDTSSPTVIGVAPSDGSSAVSTSVTPQLTFSEPVTDLAGITLTRVSGGSTVNVTVQAAGSVVTITPSPKLEAGTQYRVTAPVTVVDLGGNPLSAPFTSIFTTAAASTLAYDESSSRVVFEAEGFDTKVDQGGAAWTVVSGPSGRSGQAEQPLPNRGVSIKESIATTSPRLNFAVRFAAAGTYRVWVRGFGGDEADNSVHVGLNGAPTTTLAFVPLGSLVWSNTPQAGGVATITVPSAGVHTFNIWMREDGTQIDKVVLTRDASYVPSAIGPAVSNRS